MSLCEDKVEVLESSYDEEHSSDTEQEMSLQEDNLDVEDVEDEEDESHDDVEDLSLRTSNIKEKEEQKLRSLKIVIENCQDFEIDYTETKLNHTIRGCKNFKILCKKITPKVEDKIEKSFDAKQKLKIENCQDFEFEYVYGTNLRPELKNCTGFKIIHKKKYCELKKSFSNSKKSGNFSQPEILNPQKSGDFFQPEILNSKKSNDFVQSEILLKQNSKEKHEFLKCNSADSKRFQFTQPQNQKNFSNDHKITFNQGKQFPQKLEKSYGNKNNQKIKSFEKKSSLKQDENSQFQKFENYNQKFNNTSNRTFLTCIESVNFRNCFLRADKPPRKFQPHGSGIVNIQFGISQSQEIWKIHFFSEKNNERNNQKNIVAFEMLTHENIFLRASPTFGGLNTTNLIKQNPENLTDFEKWELMEFQNGEFGIKNCGFSSLFLSMDGKNVSETTDFGDGIVCLKNKCGINEKFYISGLY